MVKASMAKYEMDTPEGFIEGLVDKNVSPR